MGRHSTVRHAARRHHVLHVRHHQLLHAAVLFIVAGRVEQRRVRSRKLDVAEVVRDRRIVGAHLGLDREVLQIGRVPRHHLVRLAVVSRHRDLVLHARMAIHGLFTKLRDVNLGLLLVGLFARLSLPRFHFAIRFQARIHQVHKLLVASINRDRAIHAHLFHVRNGLGRHLHALRRRHVRLPAQIALENRVG